MRKATEPKQQTVIGPLKTGSDHLVLKDDDKACLMNAYFASIGEKLGLDLPPSITEALPGGSRVACLKFKKSRVCALSMFHHGFTLLLSEI